MKQWNTILSISDTIKSKDLLDQLLVSRGYEDAASQAQYLHTQDPGLLTVEQFAIDRPQLEGAVDRICRAIEARESIVVYADYDADGVSAGSIVWETLHKLGANVMPYIPHRVDEGYGLSKTGIETVRIQYNPSLLITVDHGISAHDKVKYANDLGIDVIVSDHHAKPALLPDCPIVHTTTTSGAGVAWVLAKTVWDKRCRRPYPDDYTAIATIGIVADLLPLTGVNRSLVATGVKALRETKRMGVVALLKEAGVEQKTLETHTISHVIAPRINAMGRLEHAMDALRLLCTNSLDNAQKLASKLDMTNKDRQILTEEMTHHARSEVMRRQEDGVLKRGIVIDSDSYNQGIIGLVAGRLVEEFYRPTIIIAKGITVSKGSARSIPGFNIIDAIREHALYISESGGHPLAAGFSIETKHIDAFREVFEAYVSAKLSDEHLQKTLSIDMQIPYAQISLELYRLLRNMEPFGFGNTEPIFSTENLVVIEKKQVGTEGKHLKLKVAPDLQSPKTIDAIGFSMGSVFGQITKGSKVSLAYTISENIWNGKTSVQLKLRDIHY